MARVKAPGKMERMGMSEGSTRIINGERHFGFYQDGEWIDLGKVVLLCADFDEKTKTHNLLWGRVLEPESQQ